MEHVSVTELKRALETESSNPEVLFINVCTPFEYKMKCIPGIENIPLDTLPTALPRLKQAKKIYLHCFSGGRSAYAGEFLKSQGVTASVYNVSGGLMAWERAGF